MSTTLLFDIETNGLLDATTKVHCISIMDVTSGALLGYHGDTIPEALDRLSKADVIAGHNIVGFDLLALRKVYPSFTWNKALDTLLLARLVWPDLKASDFDMMRRRLDFPKNLIGNHSLKAWGYRLGVLKGDISDSETGEVDWSTFTPEMLQYCLQDVMVTKALWDAIQKKNPSEASVTLEHEFAILMEAMTRHGVTFNKAKAVDLYGTLAKRRLVVEQQLQEVFPPRILTMKTPAYYHVPTTGARGETVAALVKQGYKRKDIEAGPMKTREIPFNPGSRDDIAARLSEKYGWKPKAFTDGGKPTVDELVLSELPYPEAKVLNEYLLLEKRIGQVAEGNEAWLKVERNGRIHGRIITNGAVTGRCTHSKPNLAQVPAVGAPYGAECRGLFGKNMVGADASGLELRCLAHYLARYDDGAYAKIILEGDIHTANQKAAGLETRNQAKTFIYAMLYGAGDEKIGSITGGGASAGKKLRAAFEKSIPAYKHLKDGVEAAATSRGYLLGLDGRHLPIRSKHSALNTLLQSAGALVMKKAATLVPRLTMERGIAIGTHYHFVLNVHDEMQSEVEEGVDREIIGRCKVKAITLAGEHFGFRCRLDGEFKLGDNWAETH